MKVEKLKELLVKMDEESDVGFMCWDMIECQYKFQPANCTIITEGLLSLGYMSEVNQMNE